MGRTSARITAWLTVDQMPLKVPAQMTAQSAKPVVSASWKLMLHKVTVCSFLPRKMDKAQEKKDPHHARISAKVLMRTSARITAWLTVDQMPLKVPAQMTAQSAKPVVSASWKLMLHKVTVCSFLSRKMDKAQEKKDLHHARISAKVLMRTSARITAWLTVDQMPLKVPAQMTAQSAKP